jgi:hypothetical protein
MTELYRVVTYEGQSQLKERPRKPDAPPSYMFEANLKRGDNSTVVLRMWEFAKTFEEFFT